MTIVGRGNGSQIFSRAVWSARRYARNEAHERQRHVCGPSLGWKGGTFCVWTK